MTQQPFSPTILAAWPSLPLAAWQDTYATLHLWTQVVGKVRLALAPMLNHWWQATLYVTARGLTTSSISNGTRVLQIDFDFLDHRLLLQTSDGATRSLPLEPRSVASFYHDFMAMLRALQVDVKIWTMPQEVQDPIPFERDGRHISYDPEYVQRFWRVLIQAHRVLEEFRSGFLGKCSPVHFFWGSFDLAVTRFSGRRAPEHPGGAPHLADWVVREAYSHEVSSCGFWPGGGAVQEPAFFAYAYPEPHGFNEYPVQPEAAFYSSEMREFILPYEAVRQSQDPDAALLAFLQTTYEAAAALGNWDRASLERIPPTPARRGERDEYRRRE
jgi:hypothetical protein